MCFPATCQRCGKTTWDGCGMHVDDVMSTVPKDQQCVCDSTPVGHFRSGHADHGHVRTRLNPATLTR